MKATMPIPLPEFRVRVARIYAAAMKATKTTQQLDHAIRLAEEAGCVLTSDLTTDAIAGVVIRRGPDANPNTTRGLLGRLRRAVNLAIRLRLLDREDEPDWASLRPPAAAPSRNRPHSAAEVARVLDRLGAREDWAGRRLNALANLVAHTGLRRNEALRLRVEDLDLEAGFVFVVARSGSRLKTAASAAAVPLPDALVGVLRGWLPHLEGGAWLIPGARREGPWVGGSPGYRPLDRLRQSGLEASVPGLGFHSLRHTLGTQLLTRGVPVWAIQRILRHTSPITTAHYLHPTDRDVAGLVRGFRYR